MHILKLYSDLETPISVFLKVAQEEDYSFLLESAEHQASFGRYSFLGIGRQQEFVLTREGYLDTLVETQKIKSNGLSVILDYLAKGSSVPYDGQMPPFLGGAVGYVSYDYVRYLEDLKLKPSGFPDFHFFVPRYLIVFDHVQNVISIIGDDPGKIAAKMAAPCKPTVTPNSVITEPVSNMSRDEFHCAVDAARRYITEGDIFQVVLSQKFRFRTTLHPFSVYRALRMVNPSPYMFYLKFGKKTVLGSSPEMLAKLQGEKVILRPLAGTRRRGKTVDEDLFLEKELLNDEKERAEHTMLLDLGRNDIGKVCRKGSVSVDEHMVVERYSHVMHLVSQVSGRLEEGKNAADLFEAVFPAGTVTGAPKPRAMEIINELESQARGPYAGAVVYFSYPAADGRINMDSGIAIRSFFFDGEDVYIQAGAGIVSDSNPEQEYKETINKLQGLFRSLEIAHRIEGGLL